MHIVSAKIQMDNARREKTIAEHKQIINSLDLKNVKSKISSMEAIAGGDKDLLAEIKKQDEYEALVEYQTEYDLQNEQLATEITMHDQEIEAYQKLQDEGINAATTFWCFGG